MEMLELTKLELTKLMRLFIVRSVRRLRFMVFSKVDGYEYWRRHRP